MATLEKKDREWFIFQCMKEYLSMKSLKISLKGLDELREFLNQSQIYYYFDMKYYAIVRMGEYHAIDAKDFIKQFIEDDIANELYK